MRPTPPEPAPEPRDLVAALPMGAGVRALDARTDGWSVSLGSGRPGVSLLGIEPDAEFRGGLDALRTAHHWLDAHRGPDPFAAVVIGSLSYELGYEIARGESPASSAEIPPVCLAGYRAVYRWSEGRGEIRGSDAGARARLRRRLEAADETSGGVGTRLPRPTSRTSDPAFRAGVEAIRAWIRAGDVYQVNLSRRLEFEPVSSRAAPPLYREVQSRWPAPFAAYLDAGDHQVISNSPERFLRVRGREVETGPIKGTRPRGSTPEEDAWQAKELADSDKDRAEHVMIADLERNDLGRVSEIGSVCVAELAGLRSFPTVHHLVSRVTGRLRGGVDWLELVAATFPGGSITGAPKLRAMEIIRELEPVERGIYTGAIGYFDAAGGGDLSIAIRTAVARDGRLTLGVGGGIVADSDPDAELAETRDKGHAFTALS